MRDTSATDQEFYVACKLLAEVPHRFRAVGTWINHFCLVAHVTQDDDIRALVLSEMEIARRELQDVMRFFARDGEVTGVSDRAMSWWRARLAETPQKGDGIRGFAGLLQEVLDSTRGDPASAFALHDRLVRYAVDHYGAELNALTEALDRALAEQDHNETLRQQAVRQDAETSVRHISKVSQKVRMISLNVAIEAARAGDAGAAFGVIAQEITALSDTIRDSSNKVGETLDALIDTRP